MAKRRKLADQRRAARDREEMRKFITIVAVATIALMILMYFILAG